MDKIHSLFAATDNTLYLQSYSALDRYFRIDHNSSRYFITNASLPELAAIFDTLEFHGLKQYDVCIPFHDKQLFFQITDSLEQLEMNYFSVMNLIYDLKSGIFIDRACIYRDLRSDKLTPQSHSIESWYQVADAAILYSRYQFNAFNVKYPETMPQKKLSVFEQRHLVSTILTSARAAAGLQYLFESGFIAAHWPELAAMGMVQQTKDYHPEGNVWQHVCEALKYRKQPDLILSLGILLHDLGKTVSRGSRDKPYRNHSLSGSILAKQFLTSLSFPEKIISDVVFLVRHHMMPEALPSMPLYRIENLLADPLFPMLLELYRSDLLATFQGPEKYYRACNLYKKFYKTLRNPYKDLKRSKRIIQ